MVKLSELVKMIGEKHGYVLDLKEKPEVLSDIITAVRVHEQGETGSYTAKNVAPFGISWMDSWAANWFLHQPAVDSEQSSEDEFRGIIQQLTDLKFRERIGEIKKFIINQGGFVNEPSDGGPPEPGTPPAGPSSFFEDEPPDGGTPEPGVPPDPGPGPDGSVLQNNPWILYWFVSINAPFILDMIDAHLTRRMNDLKQQIAK